MIAYYIYTIHNRIKLIRIEEQQDYPKINKDRLHEFWESYITAFGYHNPTVILPENVDRYSITETEYKILIDEKRWVI